MKSEIADDKNPNFIFQLIDTEILVDALNGEIDLNDLALKELHNRQLDKYGRPRFGDC